MAKTKRISLVAGALLVFLIAGCTEEKAVALKAAAEAFRDKAVEAIDTTRELLIAGAVGKKTEVEATQEAVRLVTATAMTNKTVSNDELKAAEGLAFARERASAATSKLGDVKQAYVDFGAAFARLPQGAAFAGNAVACSELLGARLVHKLALLHDSLVDAPVNYARDQSEGAFLVRKAAATGDSSEIQKASFAYLQGRKQVRTDNEEARKKLAQAVESGMEVLVLVRNYNTLSVADVLAGVSRVMEIRAKLSDITPDASIQRIKDFRAQLEGDSKIAPVLQLPAVNVAETCKS